MAGVDPQQVFNAIRGGLAGSTVMDAKVPMMMDGNFNPGFKIDLHIKDLNIQGSYIYTDADFRECVRLLSEQPQDFTGIISDVISVEQAQDMFALLSDGAGAKIKVLVDMMR